MTLGTLNRTNFVGRREEKWQPPAFVRVNGLLSRLSAAARRFLDLQAGSMWNDLSVILPRCQGTVIDVGCGAQPYRPLLAKEVRYIGIDRSDAKDRFKYEIPDTIYYDSDQWPIQDGEADVILCTETLEHVLEYDAFLAEATRCIKGGGALVLTVPFAARWHYIPYDYFRYTPSALNALLTKAGLRNVRVYPRGNAVTVAVYKVLALMSPLLARKTGSMPCDLALRLGALLCAPFMIALGVIAKITYCFDGGDDCLGYTVLADKP